RTGISALPTNPVAPLTRIFMLCLHWGYVRWHYTLHDAKLRWMHELSAEFLSLGLIWYVVFLFSTTCHEAAHALVAYLGGDSTAFEGGQVSLNPVPHMMREPFGMLLFP